MCCHGMYVRTYATAATNLTAHLPTWTATHVAGLVLNFNAFILAFFCTFSGSKLCSIATSHRTLTPISPSIYEIVKSSS